MTIEITTVYYVAMLIFGFAGFVKTLLEIFKMLHHHPWLFLLYTF